MSNSALVSSAKPIRYLRTTNSPLQKIQVLVSTEDAETIEEGVQQYDSEYASHPNASDAPAPPTDDLFDVPNEEGINFGGEAQRDEEEQVDEPVSYHMMLQADLAIMKLCEKAYTSRTSIFYPIDKRIVCIEVSIHTWVCTFYS